MGATRIMTQIGPYSCGDTATSLPGLRRCLEGPVFDGDRVELLLTCRAGITGSGNSWWLDQEVEEGTDLPKFSFAS